jgi:outer membrane protein TolC
MLFKKCLLASVIIVFAINVQAYGEETAIAPIRLADSENSYNPATLTASHEDNKILDLKPLYLSSASPTKSSKYLTAEASYDQSITLADALSYVLRHGLQSRISLESLNYQHWLTISNAAALLPTFGMSYNLSHSNIFNKGTSSMARTFSTGVNFPVFQGGGIVYGILSQHYREKGWLYAYKSTMNDVFLDVYRKYMNLIYNRVLLQIWAKTVEVDREQLAVAEAQLKAGTGTRFTVLQSKTQLASDRQSLVQQEVTARQAGLALNLSLNFPMAVNLVPVEETLVEASLFNQNVDIKMLIKDALKFSPSLKQYEMFWLAAKRTMQLAVSSFYPAVSFFVTYQQNDTQVNPAGNAADLGGIATSAIASSLDSTFAGRVSNNSLGQLQSFSPTAGATSTQGANTGPSAMPAASGGTPIANIQSGSLVSSGAVAPSIFGGGTGAGGGSNSNGSFQAPAGIFPGQFRSLLAGFGFSWTIPSFGLQNAANLGSVQALARQSLMQCNQAIDQVLQLTRNDYLSMLNARGVIDTTAYAVASSREAYRLSRVRLSQGVGTYVEEAQAQRDYISALTNQAQAIVNSNLAQAQLLHDMGMISVTTLTEGYTPGVFIDPTKNGLWQMKP